MDIPTATLGDGKPMTTTAETVIIGGGVMGCSIAYNLAANGMTDVLLLERGVLGSGATGRSTALVHTHYSTDVMARLAWQSLQVFTDFDDVVGGQCGFTQTGHLVFAGEDANDEANLQITQRVALHQSMGIKTSLITPREAVEIAPGFQLRDCGAIVYEPNSGYADASGTTLAYAERARQLGVRIKLMTPATGLEVNHGKITAVVTEQERISTERVIVAAGAWSRDLLLPYELDLPLKTTRHEVAALRRPAGSMGNPPSGSDLINQTYFRPEGVDLLLVGGGESSEPFSPQEQVTDPEIYGHRPTQGFTESVWTRLAKRIPMMKEAEYKTGFAGLYTSTPDRHPILGQSDELGGLFLCTGFSGHGFKLAPAVGVVMAGSVLGGNASSIDISSLGLSRFTSKPDQDQEFLQSNEADVVI